ncbi:MAG: 2Fe-2S iron-sulfur cluster-binding protein [Xanthobacteraceae bacterium]
MTPITLEVNGKQVTAAVAPRTHLADFLREHLLLTGTHIGCEHGVCGACTVEIDGEIARSCITYAVACDGAVVRTVEGFDDDPLMERMRRAFTQEHALQCGYCTPGMLIAARDLVRRKASRPELDTRVEMSGNLCRCTGYVGIVRAIDSVAADPAIAAVASARSTRLGPAPGPSARTTSADAAAAPAQRAERAAAAPSPVGRPAPAPSLRRRPVKVEVGEITAADGVTRLTQNIVLEHPVAAVWALMGNPEKVAPCLPGLTLDGPPQDGRLSGRMEVAIGPITARFAGTGTVTRDDGQRRMAIEARGSDRRSGSLAAGQITYALTEIASPDAAKATRVDCAIEFSLQGPLAQFGRSDLVRDLVSRIGEAFAQNVDLRLRAPEGTVIAPARLSGVSLLLGVLIGRLRAAIHRLLDLLPGRGG